MKKVSVLVLVLLIIGLGGTPALTEIGLSFGGVLGWYAPGYGEVNDDLDDINDSWGTNLGFNSGPILGFTAAYDITPNFRLRGEMTRFGQETSDSATLTYSYWYYWWYITEEQTLDFATELGVTSLNLSGIYLFPTTSSIRPYLGAGLGTFITTLKAKGLVEYREYWDGYLVDYDSYSFRDSDSDNPLGFQLIGGIEGELSENTSLVVEGRYTAVAETEMEIDDIYWEPGVDLSGFTLVGMIIFKI